jgi:hypothetical protein
MSASDFHIRTFTSFRKRLTPAQRATLAGVGGASLLGGSALAWGMSRDGMPNLSTFDWASLNPFDEDEVESDTPDDGGELLPEEDGAPYEEAPAGTAGAAPAGRAESAASPNSTPEAAVPTGGTAADEVPFATRPSDEQSFGDAFATARAETGPGGYFEWRGQLYNTFFKEEWESMSPGEQREYAETVLDDVQAGDHLIQPASVVVIEPPVVDDAPETAEATADKPEMDLAAIRIEDEVYVLGDVDGDGQADLVADQNGNMLLDTDQDGYFDTRAQYNAAQQQLENAERLDQPIAAPMLRSAQEAAPVEPAPAQYTSNDDSFGGDFDNNADVSEYL